MKEKGMRENKFRGKDLNSGEWVYGDLLHPITSCRIVNYTEIKEDGMEGADYHYYDVDPDTVGQFTGLEDRNGTEIYEGDILNIRFGAEDIVPMEVCFVNCSWCIHEDSNNEEFHNLYDYCYDAAIIGNIHDNPELVK